MRVCVCHNLTASAVQHCAVHVAVCTASVDLSCAGHSATVRFMSQSSSQCCTASSQTLTAGPNSMLVLSEPNSGVYAQYK